MRRRLVLDAFVEKIGFVGPDEKHEYCQNVCIHLLFDRRLALRKYHLYCRLLAPGWYSRQNPFRLCTYFRNGDAGCISDTEDIVDRIIDFAI